MKHPLSRRLLWNPFLLILPIASLGYSLFTHEFSVVRTTGFAIVGLWFAMSVADSLTNHRLLDWLYSDD